MRVGLATGDLVFEREPGRRGYPRRGQTWQGHREDSYLSCADHGVETVVCGPRIRCSGTSIDADLPVVKHPRRFPGDIPAMVDVDPQQSHVIDPVAVSYTHLRAHETDSYLVC